MKTQVLDLDGSLISQPSLCARLDSKPMDLQHWGPRIRMGCSFGQFRRFEAAVDELITSAEAPEHAVTLYGSGDFHHVTLALLRRIKTPFNLLVIDNHPDWMRGVPLLHCGTWLYHAARLPMVQDIYHVGGDVDFDNYFRWMAPWPMLHSGKIRVFPAIRRYRNGQWSRVESCPLIEDGNGLSRELLRARLTDQLASLSRYPLYVSLDKDVMNSANAMVNWDSGHLSRSDVQMVLESFLEMAGGRLIGMDVLGDWSPVRMQGLLRHYLHWSEHPPLKIDPRESSRSNDALNCSLLELVDSLTSPHRTRRVAV